MLAVLVVLVAASSALAAAHFRAGASYTGKTCQSTQVKGTTCVYRFRASSNGTTLKFVGTTGVTGWGCNGGGGEALLGGKHEGADALPVIKVQPKGTLYGSAGKGDAEVSVTWPPRRLGQDGDGDVPPDQRRLPHVPRDAHGTLTGAGRGFRAQTGRARHPR